MSTSTQVKYTPLPTLIELKSGEFYRQSAPDSEKVLLYIDKESADANRGGRFVLRTELAGNSVVKPFPSTALSGSRIPDLSDDQLRATANGFLPSINHPIPVTIEKDTPPPEARELTAEDLLNRKADKLPTLVGNIMPKVGLAALIGSSDTGKSAWLRQLAFAVATRQSDFLGHTLHGKWWSAIVASTEDDEQATSFLLNCLNKHLQVDPADCSRLRFVFDTHELLKTLDTRLTEKPADLVVVDAFGDLYSGDANKSNQIRAFLHDYSQLAQKHQCLIMFLHHVGKRTENDVPSKHSAIGGMGFEAKMRLLIELRKDHNDPDRRHLCIVKGNYLPSEYKESSYALSFEDFLFQDTGERVPFEQLAKPKEQIPDEGQNRYDQIQKARQAGYKGEALATYLGWSKGYISQIERKYAPKTEPQ